VLQETINSYDGCVSLDRWKISEINKRNLGPVTSTPETCWKTHLYVEVILKQILKKYSRTASTGLNCLRVWSSFGLS